MALLANLKQKALNVFSKFKPVAAGVVKSIGIARKVVDAAAPVIEREFGPSSLVGQAAGAVRSLAGKVDDKVQEYAGKFDISPGGKMK